VARIRTIKPEFPQSESIGRIGRDARLLLLQLFTIVDDAGKTRAASRMLASLLYPYDDDAGAMIGGWLDELEANDFVRRYVVDGSTYLQINNWLKHQKIDHPSKSRLPDPLEPSRSLAKSSEVVATDLNLVPSTLDLGPSEKENKIVVASEGVKKGKPKHGAISACKRFVYWKRGSTEFLAYAEDYQEATGDEPEATEDGRWFKVLGEKSKGAA
jgi:hypothetical protein